MKLEYLCKMEFRYDEAGFTQLTPFGGTEGLGYGTGIGSVKGDRLEGQLRWSTHPNADLMEFCSQIRMDSSRLPTPLESSFLYADTA